MRYKAKAKNQEWDSTRSSIYKSNRCLLKEGQKVRIKAAKSPSMFSFPFVKHYPPDGCFNKLMQIFNLGKFFLTNDKAKQKAARQIKFSHPKKGE